MNPPNVPLYFMNSGFDVWNKILILSKGATKVLAQDPAKPPARPDLII
ncbi:Uncharacterised protein [Chlamydia trachomatis]|nr:Uncharacterised protein [Chlamydia trachomatis]